MATFLSAPSGAGSRANQSERRFADRLAQFLEDDYFCWYDVPVGPQHQHPDFLILNPRRGILILEVKDWKLDQIREVSPTSFTMDFGAGLKVKANPLEQARHYAHAVTRVLERDQQLLNGPESPHVGRLCFPYGYGVVLASITRRQLESRFESLDELERVLPGRLIICKDEMTESVDAEEFQKRLWDMFTVRFPALLTQPQVDRIRWHLFPEIRITQGTLSLGRSVGGGDPALDALHVMDLHQEAVARGLGDGHRVIHGVAGSGKTLILAYRAQYLARALNKPILVLVFNKALASWLQQQMVEKDLTDRVTVRNFHAWCYDLLSLFHVPKPEDGPDFPGRMVDAVIRAVDRGQIPRAQYGALLIDEGHDFEPDWLKLAVQMLDPESNSFLLLYDDAQSIYGKRKSAGFSFRSLGISASGRTRILKRNYRNTVEILNCAREFARDVLEAVDADDDSIPSLIPESGERKGPQPKFCELASLRQEAQLIATEVKRLHDRGTQWREIGVFYPVKFVGETIMESLAAAAIPVEWLKDAKAKQFNPMADSVKLMTAQSSKGLQYRAVIVAGAGYLPYRSDSELEDSKVMYVALTRATHELIVTTSKSSRISERLKALCAPLAA